MAYVTRWGPSLEYDTAADKASLVVETELGERSTCTFNTRNQPSVGFQFVLGINTVNSPVFGGTVRAIRRVQARRDRLATYEIDVDDWQTMLDRSHPYAAYSSVAAHSIVKDLVAGFTNSFTTAGVADVKCAASSIAWDRLTVSFNQGLTVGQAINSVVGLCAPVPGATNDPITWWIDPMRDVHLVGAISSMNIVIDVTSASDRDLVRYEEGYEMSSFTTTAYVWCSSMDNFYPTSPGQTPITVNSSTYVGNPSSMVLETLYIGYAGELIPVNSVNGGDIYISSLNTRGVLHGYLPSGADIRPVVRVESTGMVADLVDLMGNSMPCDVSIDASTVTNPVTQAAAIGRPYLVGPTALSYLRARTLNTLATAGALLYRGTGASGAEYYPIQRCRLSGFDRGDAVPAYHDVEASITRRLRVTDIL